MFKKVDPKFDLPKTEEEILKFWDENKIFEKSLKIHSNGEEYSFYDGPPFATGSPHYGHIVASTMKDVVPRYWTMKGYRVPRKWGWDCHGLPIENIAEKELGITHKKDIEKIGIEKFNEVCRSKVLEYVNEWKIVIRRLGRWADMENSYKTMDLPFMESVWWTFKELWDKGLIYEGYRSMHICPRCETTLSQSEVSEGYRNIKDLSVVAKFELLSEVDENHDPILPTDKPVYVLAWTTTPWTLIGNVALAINGEIEYSLVKSADVEEYYIIAKDRLKETMKDIAFEVVKTMKGKELIGFDYRPLFDYYFNNNFLENHQNGWKIYSAPFVTTEEGTGVVHIAPAFGEDDMNLGKEKNLPFIQHIGMDGIIKPEATEFAGMNAKPADDTQKTDVEIIKYLDEKNLLFDKEKYEHSYPHCWRCETPLLNYATSSWFVNITKIKDEAIELSKEIKWSPKHIKAGRFGKWLEGARDWSISRQRFWASVIPIWKCDKCDEIVVVGSVAELEELSGQKVDNLHKHVVDKIKFSCKKCGGQMIRVPDVLDTWFDSGSMPYAQSHYPFENKEAFEKGFPAEFIAEGVDQTRAWFYYLHVIATAIKKSVAFKNVVVNGIVLAKDGKKMSKRLKNYPDPIEIFNKFGADPTRFYLLSSPVMCAENLNFNEAEIAELSRGMFRMFWNSYSFFVLYANIDKLDISIQNTPLRQGSEGRADNSSNNLLDKWIFSELNTLISAVDKAMSQYELNKAARLFPSFIDNLSNWYIRRSRKRFWKSENDSDKEMAYHTLYEVLVTLSKLMAPFTPFISEEIYKNLTGKESVHLENYPQANENAVNPKLNDEMILTRKIVELGLSKRAGEKIKVRQPLLFLTYGGQKLETELEQIIAEEVNVKNVYYEKDEPDIKIDTNISPELKMEGDAREMVRNIQSLRKKTDFNVDDRIFVNYETDSEYLEEVMAKMSDLIAKEVLAEKIEAGKAEVDGEDEFALENEKIWIGLRKKIKTENSI